MSRIDRSRLDECDGCAIAAPARREFVRRLAQAMIGTAALGAVSPLEAAVAMGELAAIGRAGKTVSYPLPAADGVAIDRVNDVILTRWQGALYAFSLACPHQNTALRWLDRDQRFQCPKHHSKYAPDGAFLEGRATRAMDRLGVTLAGTVVTVDLDRYFRRDTDPAGWVAAVVHLDRGAA